MAQRSAHFITETKRVSMLAIEDMGKQRSQLVR